MHAAACGRESLGVGKRSAEVLHLLHEMAVVIRSQLASRFWRRGPLLQAYRELEAGMAVLRREYLETYDTLSQQQHEQLHERIVAIVTAGLPEEMLKQVVTAAYTLSGADYVVLHLAVETSEIGSCLIQASHDAEVEMVDETPAWCRYLVAQLSDGTSICLDDTGSLDPDLIGNGAPDGACLGVALKSENGIVGYIFCLRHQENRTRFHACDLKRIETLAMHASEAISTSLIHTEMRAHTRFLYTISSQTSLSLQQFRIRLRDNQNRLERLVQHFPDGVLMLGTDYRVVMANPAGRDYLAILTDAGVGEPLTGLGIYPIEFLLLAPEEGRRYEVESLLTPSRVFYVEVNVLQTGQATDGWLLVLHDVSEKRQVRQHIQQQEHLTDAGQLVAGVAHDFNILLDGTIGMARSLEALDGMPPIAQERLARIVELGTQGSKLVRQMLDFTPTPVNALQPLDLHVFLTEACGRLKPVIPKQVDLVLTGTSAAEGYTVRADAGHLEQALMSLALNAIDAMPNGGQLRLGLSRLTCWPGEPTPCAGMSAGEWVVLTVTDTGRGTSEVCSHGVDASSVLESLTIESAGVKPSGQSSELGLSLVHGMVKQHQGYMQLERQASLGTMVSIYLPAEPASADRSRSSVGEELPHGNGEVVLLVDDDVIVREGSQALLEYLGYRVLTAENGRHALEVYHDHQHEIDLVLTDIVMPELDGVQLFHRLQALNPNVRIVMMTGHPLGEERRQLLEQGMVDWVQKPLDLALLAETMQRGLAQ